MATPNMDLTLPVVGVTVGPTYATLNNDAFTAIDAHDHTTDKGVQVPSAGLNINADLTFGTTSGATDVKFVELAQQASALSGPGNEEKLHSVLGDLYWTNESGTAVPITNGGSLDVSAAGGFDGDYSADLDVSAAYTTSTKLFTFRSDTSPDPKAAAIDGGALTIRETDVANGKGLTIKLPSSYTSDTSWTVPDGNPADRSKVLRATTGGVIDYAVLPTVTIGDGVTSFGDHEGTDKVPFTDAIAALPDGGVIFVGAGTYTFATKLTVSQDDIVIKGAGRGQTLVAGSIAGDALIEISADRVGIEGIGFTGTGDPTTGTTPVIRGLEAASEARVTSCSFTNTFAQAAADDPAPAMEWGGQNSYIYNNVFSAVNGSESNQYVVRIGNLYTNDAAADCAGNHFYDNRIDLGGAGGTDMEAGLLIVSSSDSAAVTTRVHNNTIHDNMFSGSVDNCEHGIKLSAVATNAGATASLRYNMVHANAILDVVSGTHNFPNSSHIDFATSGSGSQVLNENGVVNNICEGSATIISGVADTIAGNGTFLCQVGASPAFYISTTSGGSATRKLILDDFQIGTF